MTTAPWSHSLVESMSTYQLASAIQHARSPGQDDGPRPSPRLLQRMAQEWDERPDHDRFAALALLQDGA